MFFFYVALTNATSTETKQTGKKENSSSNLRWKKVIMEVDCLVNYEAEK